MNRFEILRSLPKTFCANIRLFGLKGVYCPILLKYNCKINRLKRGMVEIDNFSFGIVSIGFGGTSSIDNQRSMLEIVGGVK